MQADIDAEIDLMILRIPPTGINDLVCICRSIHRSIGNAIVHAIMAIVIHPIAKAIRPISTCTGVANAGLWRRYPRGRGRGTSLARFVTCKCDHTVVEGIVGRRMIEDRLLGSRTGIGRVKKWCNNLKRRGRVFRRGTAHTEAESAEQEGCQYIF
jgi:hypothetical protein